MLSQEQLAANRANGQHSHGPVSPEGKAKVAQNAVTHGLASRNIFLPGEDPADWHTLRDQLRESFHAEGAPGRGGMDDLFLDLATHAAWKLRRLEEWTTMLIAAAFLGQPVPAPLARLFGADHEPAMKRLERYESTARGALNRALSHLRAQAKQRLAEQRERETQARQAAKPPHNRTNPIPPSLVKLAVTFCPVVPSGATPRVGEFAGSSTRLSW